MSDQSWPAPGSEPTPPSGGPPGPAPAPYGATPYGAAPYGSPPGGGYAAPPPPPGWNGPPGPWRPPVAKPGVVPLRQLTLGDIFGGALQTIRRNPRATIATALAVSAAFMALPLLASLLWGTLDLGSFDLDSGSTQGSDTLFTLATYSGTLFNVLASLVITGLMTRVVASAVVGRPMGAGEAWRRTRGRLPALLGLVLVSFLVTVVALAVPVGVGLLVGLGAGEVVLGFVVGGVLALLTVAALVFVWTRYLLLATPALVLEDLSVGAALRRAGALSRGQFWRLLGIGVLAQLAAGVVAQVFAIPFAVLGVVVAIFVESSWGPAVLLLTTNLSTLLTTALVGPFVAGVTALQYVDQRFRKEGLDLTLLERSLDDGPG